MKLERQEEVSETLAQPGEARLPRWQGRGGRRTRQLPGRFIGVAQLAAGCWGTCGRWPRITRLHHTLLSPHLLPHATPGSLPAAFPAAGSAAPSPLRPGQGLVELLRLIPAAGKDAALCRRLVPPPARPLWLRGVSPRAQHSRDVRAGPQEPAPWASPGTRPVPAGCAEPPRGPPGSVQPSRAA